MDANDLNETAASPPATSATESCAESPIAVPSSSPLPSPSHPLLILAAKASWKPKVEADNKNVWESVGPVGLFDELEGASNSRSTIPGPIEALNYVHCRKVQWE